MANAPRRGTASAKPHPGDVRIAPELNAELASGIAELDRGEYVALTREQLDRAASTGELPWTEDESRG